MAYLVKLVRDNVDELVGGPGTCTYEPLPHDEHVKALRAKLAEEVGEYLVDPSLGELADVYEVVAALARIDLGVPYGVLVDAAAHKREVRGGFSCGLAMMATHPSDTEKWAA